MSCQPTSSPYTTYVKISRFYNEYDFKKYHDSMMVLPFTIGQIYSLITDLKNNIYFHGEYIPLKDFKSIQEDITKILKKWNDNHNEITLSLIKLSKTNKPQDVKNITDFIELLKKLKTHKLAKQLKDY